MTTVDRKALNAAPETTGSAGKSSGGRRRDVEGLRGVAIMMVVVFHIWVGTVSGGVDAFLFISGFFLIPSLIRAQIGAKPLNNPLPRIGRVLKRLWIPMAAVVAFTVLGTWWFYPSSRMAETLSGAVWSDLFVENWALGLHGQTYAAGTALPSPFQHLWSLSVQAQIFVVLIGGITLLGLALRQLAKHADWFSPSAIKPVLIGIVAAGAAASFGYATFIGSANQTLNYYNTFSRFWEIALGGLVAFALTDVTVTGWLRQVAGVLGLVMLGITGFVVDGATQFPGPAALLPLGGAVLVFLAGTGGTSMVSRGLSTKPVVYLGSIAYPLYLWHWPLLILFLVYQKFHATAVKQVSLLDGLAIIAISLVLAAVTEFLLKPDSPIRKLRIRTPVILAGTAAALVVAVQAWTAPVQVATAETIDWALHPGAAAAAGTPTPPDVAFVPSARASRSDLPETGMTGCFNNHLVNADVVSCDFGAPREPGRKVLTLLGGSHAEHFLPALNLIGKKYGFTVETVIMAGCLLADGPTADQSHESQLCRDWQVNAMNHVLETRPDAVFTNSTRPALEYGHGDRTPDFYVAAFQRLSDAGIPVVGVRDLPWLTTPDGEKREPFDCMDTRKDPVKCGAERAKSLLPEDPAIPALSGIPGVHLLDFTDLYCGPIDCPAVIGNVLVYRDSHHFTRTYMLTMTPFIERELASALGWYPAPAD